MYSTEYYQYLKYCPECGKELERNPLNGESACFLHGDFEPNNNKIVWRYTENLIKRD